MPKQSAKRDSGDSDVFDSTDHEAQLHHHHSHYALHFGEHAAIGLREAMSYAIPGGSGMRRRKCVVGIKCGTQEHLAVDFTGPDNVGGSDPVWHQHHHRVVHLERHVHDAETAVLELHQLKKDGETRAWVGGNHFKFTKALREPNTEFDLDVPLFVSGTPNGGAGSGVVSIKFMWKPDEQSCNLEDLEKDTAYRGKLEVTVIKARGLVMPDRIVRDVTTYVDGTPVGVAFVLLIVYLMVGFFFYFNTMNETVGHEADFDRFPKLLDRIQGGNGEWDSLNTVMFMVTTFTTVGYGNHPSLVATRPPCEIPGPQLVIDDPFSDLLPAQLRSSHISRIPGMSLAASQRPTQQSFRPLPTSCFENVDLLDRPAACMCIADDAHIFDFSTLLLWEKGSLDPPRNFSDAAKAQELQIMRVPGDTGIYDCPIRAAAGRAGGEMSNETQRACYARFAAACEDQLKLWRKFEQQKDVAKLFTSVFIMIGIGILGAVVGATGETLMEWVRNLLGGVEYGRICNPCTAAHGTF